MKVVCLLGSPRPSGNTETIAQKFLEVAKEKGAETQVYALNKLKYRGCQACMACKGRTETCVLKDDLSEVLEAVRNSDILLLTAPVYYADIPSQLKAFIDRTFCYLTPDFRTNPDSSRLAKGKKLVFICVQADPDETHFTDIYDRYQRYFQWYGFADNHQIRGVGLLDKKDIEKHPEILQKTAELANQLVG